MPSASQENTHLDDPAGEMPIPLQSGSPVNIFLIVGSVILALWTHLGNDPERLAPWVISQFPARSAACLLELRHGEIWRLLTPVFLHFSVAHLGFNVLNMMMLGNLLERRLRSRHYLLVTLSIALLSNLGQYFVSGHPYFGGLSGIVYGLIGYVWLRGRRDPTFGLALPTQTLVLALVWFVLCFTGTIGSIANTAHSVGLVLGAIWGLADGQAAVQKFRASHVALP